MSRQFSEEEVSTICFFLGTSPHLSPDSLIKRVRKYHSIDLTVKDLERILKEERDEIDKYRLGGTFAVQKGLKLGVIKYAPLLERLDTLGKIVEMGVDGYEEERVTKDGVTSITIKNFPASLEALKQIHGLMEEVNDMEDDEFEQPVGIFPDAT